MNTIPLTFDEHQINRTVVGGRQNNEHKKMDISVILLNSNGSHFKLHVFENLLSCGFDSVISVENDSNNFSIEEVSKKFPEIKFIIPLEKCTEGELINLAVSEIKSEYFLILKDSLYIPSGVLLPNLAEKLTNDETYCLVPRLLDKNKNGINCLFSPGAEKSHFVIDGSSIVTDGIKTIYPFDRIGLYNRKKFIQMGGFDYTITSPYWQNLDLAIRSWLWGEKTKVTTMLQFSYIDEIPVEDTTVNLDYLRYYLKNEVPRFKNEAAYIKKTFFHKFLRHSSCGYLEARRQFKCARLWVEKNKYYFKKDLPNFIQNWNEDVKE